MSEHDDKNLAAVTILEKIWSKNSRKISEMGGMGGVRSMKIYFRCVNEVLAVSMGFTSCIDHVLVQIQLTNYFDHKFGQNCKF